MRLPLPNSLLRHSAARPAIRGKWNPSSSRFASSNVETAQKKAQDALASAQKNAEKIIESSKNFLGPAGEKAGKILGGACLYSGD